MMIEGICEVSDLGDLQVAICDGDVVLRVVEIPDPRVVFCGEFNRADTGHVARPLYPVSRAIRLASSSRRSE